MRLLLTVLLVLAVALLAACGGSSSAEELYGDYRSAEDERESAESRLREAFGDIALAAESRDRAGVLAAVEQAQAAADEIDKLLEDELDAAGALAQTADLAVSAKRLGRGLTDTRESLRLFVQELEIASVDPFLDGADNAQEISRLSRRATELAVRGEGAIRRADRALALALGIEPRIDRSLDPAPTTAP
jgi:hypothetical protein